MPSVPQPFTLPNLTTKDKMNLGGALYSISSVGAASDNGNGVITYAVTLTDANTTTINVGASNCVRQTTISDVSGNVLYQIWSQSVKA